MEKRIISFINNNFLRDEIVGISRTFLACGLIITLIFNDYTTLFGNGANVSHTHYYLSLNLNIFTCFENTMFGIVSAILILIIVASGFLPRYTCLLHFYVSYSFSSITTVPEGGDQIGTMVVFLLIPICLSNSNTWHWKKKPYNKGFYKNAINYFSINLIKFQAAIIYFHSSIGKLYVEDWINGTALYYWFNDPFYGLPPYLRGTMNFLLSNSYFAFYSNWFVVIFELFLSLAIFYPLKKRTKRLILQMAICFHLTIMIFHGLISFFFPMLALLLLCFICQDKESDFAKERSGMVNIS